MSATLHQRILRIRHRRGLTFDQIAACLPDEDRSKVNDALIDLINQNKMTGRQRYSAGVSWWVFRKASK
jgi:hypothetical protein